MRGGPRKLPRLEAVHAGWSESRRGARAGGQKLELNLHDGANALAYAHSPCMSTGVFITYPSNASIAFLDDVTRWMWVNGGQQWEQAAFNEVSIWSVMQQLWSWLQPAQQLQQCRY